MDELTCEECGNDLAAEGYRVCTQCLHDHYNDPDGPEPPER